MSPLWSVPGFVMIGGFFFEDTWLPPSRLRTRFISEFSFEEYGFHDMLHVPMLILWDLLLPLGQACAQMRAGAFKCKCKRRIKCKCTAAESNANAFGSNAFRSNANAFRLNATVIL